MIEHIRSAQVVVPCHSLDDTLAFFVERLGMRLEAIFPADSPSVAVVSGHGVRVRLDSHAHGDPGRLRLLCDDPAASTHGVTELVAPNGTVVELAPASPPLDIPPLVASVVVDRLADGQWGVGRAGMRYRDLLPDRLGGRFIASNIAIPDAGLVPDYVHYHRVRFQMIFVRRGWVRVVYEGQGESFVMNEGDCVLQPPEIRHRVLENSDAFEVVEVSCPAEHETHADWQTELPSPPLPADHAWWGQRFVRHVAADATWRSWTSEGFEHRDTGITAATDGLAGVRVVRPLTRGASTDTRVHDGELWFGHILYGSADLDIDGEVHALVDGDSVAIPAGRPHRLSNCSGDLQLLEVSLPG